MSSSLGHYGLLPTRLLYPWGSPGKNTGVGCHAMPSSKCSSQRRDQIRSSTLQADSLPSKPPGKPQNTAVGSLFLLQDIFPAQELSQGLLCWATREPHTHIYQQSSSMAHDWVIAQLLLEAALSISSQGKALAKDWSVTQVFFSSACHSEFSAKQSVSAWVKYLIWIAVSCHTLPLTFKLFLIINHKTRRAGVVNGTQIL